MQYFMERHFYPHLFQASKLMTYDWAFNFCSLLALILAAWRKQVLCKLYPNWQNKMQYLHFLKKKKLSHIYLFSTAVGKLSL